jgi:hypothetical protein
MMFKLAKWQGIALLVVLGAGIAAAYVKARVDEARAEGRAEVVLEKWVADSTAHAEYVAAAMERAKQDSLRTAILKDSLNVAVAVADASEAKADSLAEVAEEAWEEAREELDPADYNEIRAAYDALDDAHDKCSLALKNCGTLTAQLEDANNDLRADLAERDVHEADANEALQAMRIELKKANEPDYVPWIIAGVELLIIGGLIIS